MRLKPALCGLLLATAAAPGVAAETWQEPNTGMEFVAVAKGCFKMGLPAGALQEADPLFRKRLQTEMPEHEACLDAYWIGRHEVREADWQKVMGAPHSARAGDAPVAGVSWEEAQEFARRLSELSAGKVHFRLPTEAEWEYACRASAPAATELPNRRLLDGKAWYSSPYANDNAGIRLQEVQPVGGKAANALGLHDMLGNVWEWVQDGYRADAYARHALYNPVVSAPGDNKVIRGGSIRSDPQMLRCEARGWLPRRDTHSTVGLRLVRDR